MGIQNEVRRGRVQGAECAGRVGCRVQGVPGGVVSHPVHPVNLRVRGEAQRALELRGTWEIT